MEARSLTQKDLWKIFRLERNYFRSISREALHQQNAGKKLAEFFHVGAELFI
jgi:hypothetical protein